MSNGHGEPASERSWLGVVAVAAPLLLVGLIYGKTARFPFVWDDLIFGNLPVYESCSLSDVVLSPANGFEYLPVRDLTYCFDRAVFGGWAGGAHLVNVLLFAIAVALAQTLYRFLFARARDPALAARAVPMAFVAALVLAAHPLQVEPVAFVTCRNALLALVFVLASLVTYARHLEAGGRLAYVASIVLVPAAIFSKVTAVCLPLLIAVLHRYMGRSRESAPGLVEVLRGAAPHLAIAVPIAAMQLFIASSRSTLAGSLGLADTLSRLPRVAFIPQFYLYKFAWPFHQSTEYVLTGVRENWLGLGVATLGFAGVAAFLLWRGWRPLSLAACLVLGYAAALVPVLNLVPSHPPVADRYAQIPLLFLAPGVALALSRLPLRASLALGIALAAFLGLLSFRQVDVWKSQELLFGHAAKMDPRAVSSLEYLGHVLLSDGREPEAIATFERLAAVSPGEARHLVLAARRAQRLGDPERARALLADAGATRGVGAYALFTMGEVYEMRGEKSQAIASYERSRRKAQRTAHRDGRMVRLVERADERLLRLRASR